MMLMLVVRIAVTMYQHRQANGLVCRYHGKEAEMDANYADAAPLSAACLLEREAIMLASKAEHR